MELLKTDKFIGISETAEFVSNIKIGACNYKNIDSSLFDFGCLLSKEESNPRTNRYNTSKTKTFIYANDTFDEFTVIELEENDLIISTQESWFSKTLISKNTWSSYQWLSRAFIDKLFDMIVYHDYDKVFPYYKKTKYDKKGIVKFVNNF